MEKLIKTIAERTEKTEEHVVRLIEMYVNLGRFSSREQAVNYLMKVAKAPPRKKSG
jgi:hypothetical protein